MARVLPCTFNIALLFLSLRLSAHTLPPGGSGPVQPPFVQQQYRFSPGEADEIVYSEYILRNGEKAEDKIKKNIFIRVSASKKTCYIGEPILVTYKLYTRLKSESNLSRNPSFNGFSVTDMQRPSASDYTVEKIDGREYNVFLLRQAQLYPMQAGQLELDAAETDNSIRFIKEAYFRNQEQYLQNRDQYLNYLTSNFDNAGLPAEAIAVHRVQISSTPVVITVKDFPAAGKPAAFSGATGRFSITASAAVTKLTTGDAAKLRLTISGGGNMQLLTPPAVQWPEGLDASEPALSESLSKNSVPMSGSRHFDYTFTVSKPGSYTIPPVHFCYFDPSAGSYRSDSTRAVSIEVVEGNGNPVTIAAAEAAPEKFFNKLFANRWLVAGPVIGLILGGLLLWLRREYRKDKEAAAQQTQTAEQAAESESALLIPDTDPLEAAAEKLTTGSPAAFYTALNSCLKNYLAKRLELHPAELGRKNIAEALDRQGIANSTALELSTLLDEIEWQLFTPAADADRMQEFYGRAAALTAALSHRA